MSILNLGIIGAGRIIRTSHLPALAKLSDKVKIVAIADVDHQLAIELGNIYGIPLVYKNYQDLLRVREIDAVVIAVPNYMHGKISIDAMNAGKHVFCEKPMALNQSEAELIASVHKKTGLTYVLGLNNRFRRDVDYLKKRIEDEEFGEIQLIKSAWIRRAGIPGWGSWFTSRELSGGGALMDLGVHMLDLALYLTGHPDPASATGNLYSNYRLHDLASSRTRNAINKQGVYDVEDAANSYIRFGNGSTLLLDICWAGNIPKDDFNLQIVGSKGGAYLDSNKGLYLFGEKNGHLETIQPQIIFDQDEMKCHLWSYFIGSIQRGDPTFSMSKEGVIVHKIIDAIYESDRQRTEIRIND